MLTLEKNGVQNNYHISNGSSHTDFPNPNFKEVFFLTSIEKKTKQKMGTSRITSSSKLVLPSTFSDSLKSIPTAEICTYVIFT